MDIDPVGGRPVLQLRAGVATPGPLVHPYLCLEGEPLAVLSVEGCGHGAGFLYPQEGTPDLAHFRLRVPVVAMGSGRMDGSLRIGAGIAEAERGPDAAGFRFGRDDDAVEGAGPELSASVQVRGWVIRRGYLSLDGNAGLAWIAAAPEVYGQVAPWVPFGALTLGAGF